MFRGTHNSTTSDRPNTTVTGASDNAAAVDGVASLRKLEVGECDDREDCGGGDGDISCTPYYFKPHTNSYQDCLNSFNDQGDDPEYGGFAAWTGDAQSAQAWIVDDDGSGCTDSGDCWYVVFHGCDGSGVQADDCNGDAFYWEMFGPSQWDDNWPNCDFDCGGPEGSTWQEQADQGVDCQHQKCGWKHPGTQTQHEWYSCGWWMTGPVLSDANGADIYFDTGVSGQYAYDNDTPGKWPLSAYAHTYNWVCHDTNAGGDGNVIFNEAWADGNKDIRCYCDNEPAQYCTDDGDCSCQEALANGQTYTEGGCLAPPGMRVFTFDMYPSDCSTMKMTEREIYSGNEIGSWCMRKMSQDEIDNW